MDKNRTVGQKKGIFFFSLWKCDPKYIPIVLAKVIVVTDDDNR